MFRASELKTVIGLLGTSEASSFRICLNPLNSRNSSFRKEANAHEVNYRTYA